VGQLLTWAVVVPVALVLHLAGARSALIVGIAALCAQLCASPRGHVTDARTSRGDAGLCAADATLNVLEPIFDVSLVAFSAIALVLVPCVRALLGRREGRCARMGAGALAAALFALCWLRVLVLPALLGGQCSADDKVDFCASHQTTASALSAYSLASYVAHERPWRAHLRVRELVVRAALEVHDLAADTGGAGGVGDLRRVRRRRGYLSAHVCLRSERPALPR
jgi:hypothetical protein